VQAKFSVIGGFGGESRARGPNKFQESLFGASRMQENLLAAGALPLPRWGSLQRSSSPELLDGAGGERAGCHIPKNTTPALGP